MSERSYRKVRIGKVVSNRMNKTAIVTFERRKQHPVYGKTVKATSKLYVHDEKNDCNIGDMVKVMETRPISKLKRWRLVGVLERAK
ncbi:MAG: 30S ribosomal protein S17 [candidate division Zixibacteria bacterium]|nr:30S ribosomal protein S17 [candidate division Zixibacteria bacterium]